MSFAVGIGVMMCSHTPDTTSPIANPEKPLTKPPAKAARTNRVKKNPSIGRPPTGVNKHLDGDSIWWGGRGSPGPANQSGPVAISIWQAPLHPKSLTGPLIAFQAKCPPDIYRASNPALRSVEAVPHPMWKP